jgi:hypothetical protein
MAITTQRAAEVMFRLISTSTFQRWQEGEFMNWLTGEEVEGVTSAEQKAELISWLEAQFASAEFAKKAMAKRAIKG